MIQPYHKAYHKIKCFNPITRLIIKSNGSIALVWEVAFELHLLSPSDFNATIVVKMSLVTEDIWRFYTGELLTIMGSLP